MPSKWLKAGFWNTLELAITRAADAGLSILLLWLLAPEIFAQLALAQAWVAPLLIAFVAPETVMYRDFGAWKKLGDDVLYSRLRAFRLFNWSKVLCALGASLVGGWLWGRMSGPASADRIWALLWAFAIVLAPQFSGADREFLRINLDLKTLNAVNLYQKLTLFGGTWLAVGLAPPSPQVLALVAAASALTTTAVACWAVNSRLRAAVNAARSKPLSFGEVRAHLREALFSYTAWNHASGVIYGWSQTMDLFFLGIFAVGAREVGLYAAALKLGNFVLALPLAMTSLFSVWLSRQVPGEREAETEASHLARIAGLVFLAGAVQLAAVALFGEWLIALLSRGKWSAAEQAQILSWFLYIGAGATFTAVGFVVSSWLSVRSSPRRLLLLGYVPWGLAALAIYGALVYSGGLASAAPAHLLVGATFPLYFAAYRRSRAALSSPAS